MAAEVTLSSANGFARLLFRFRREVTTEVQLTGSILVVKFTEPIDIDVERLGSAAPDYVSAARRDPDGLAIRIALARPVRPSLIPVGERVFLDLLPGDWKGPPPGPPQEVIEELARRVRAAEKRAGLARQPSAAKAAAPVRVSVATQPTFTRYVFPLSRNIAVTSDRDRDHLSLRFDAALRFDLADAVAALPPFIGAMEAKLDESTASVRFAFSAKVDVRSFREEETYVVDVSPLAEQPAPSDALRQLLDRAGRADAAPANSAPALEHRPPETVPAAPAPASVAPPLPAVAEAPLPPQPAAPVAPSVSPKDADAAPSTSAGAAPAPSAPALAATSKPTPEAKPGSITVEVKRESNSARLFFPFLTPTPAAVFRRADTLWLVFDTDAGLNLAAVQPSPKSLIRGMELAAGDGLVLRFKLDRPRLSSLTPDGSGWALTISDSEAGPTEPIQMSRNIVGPNRGSVIVAFEGGRRVHRLTDPEVGDALMVVTALAPVRGLLKPHQFVEFNALPSSQGLVIEPLADDVLMQLTPERVVIGRPQGLTLSAHFGDGPHTRAENATIFDLRQWSRDRDSNFFLRQSELINAAAAAPPEQQSAAHVNLARFYIARGMYYEAKAAMDVALSVERAKADESGSLVVRAIAKIMMHRPDEALQDLAHNSVGNQRDAPLWRAMAHAQQHKWVAARAGFKDAQMSLGILPVELQRYALLLSVRAALEVGDVADAGNQLNDFETIGTPSGLQPTLSVLRGRLAEKLGRIPEAVADYAAVTGSTDREAATQARLRLAMLRMGTGELKRDEAIAELETLSVIWRGDQTEIEALQLLARLYTQQGRVRDALGVMRAAMTANARSDVTRHIQDEAAATFESLFLSGKGEALPAIDALSLFYDFRDLTPMGRRGDEMIRRLAERLVSVDLLDQAAELLQHQVDHRLEGAARAQVAVRLAMIYLMNHKPDRALAVLRATHIAGLPNIMRDRRLLIESRALSQLGRPDVALEVIDNLHGREAERQRANVLWKARRWRPAAEQFERLLGNRWSEWQPLDALARADVLRAAIGYALGEDAIGLERLRGRYAAKMAGGPDSRAFDVVTAAAGVGSAEFRSVASNIGSLDTLDAFLHDLQAGVPELGGSAAAVAEDTGRIAPAGKARETTAPGIESAAGKEKPQS